MRSSRRSTASGAGSAHSTRSSPTSPITGPCSTFPARRPTGATRSASGLRLRVGSRPICGSAPPPPYDPKAVAPYDPAVSRAASVLALAALVAMIGATAAFLVAAPHLPLANGIGVFLSLAATLWAMGALLDGRVSICEALYVFAAASTCAAYALDWPVVQDVMKPLAMALLILAFALRKGLLDVKRLVLAALAASLIGDTLLLRPSLFLPGLVAFLAAHCFYVAAFSRGVGFLPSRVALGGIAAFAALVLAYVWPGVSPDLKAPVVIYVGVISLMAAQAIGRAIVLGAGAAFAVAAGAFIFMLSDLTIALDKFGNVGWPADQWTLPTYYLAQGLIAFCVLPREC